ncbi:MAG: hypothetical protein K1W16_04185 [Lachnospiraceae bacterium]
MSKRKLRTIILAWIIVLVTVMQPLTVNAMTVFESDGLYHEEGYIVIGESHNVLAAHALSMRATETNSVISLGENNDIYYEYRWDSSREKTNNGQPNTFTMKGNLFFVFEGNNAGVDDVRQTSQQYIYSDGKGKQGRGVQKIHEIINTNPNIAHWNIISFHGAVSASKGSKQVADFYVNSYRNWINYEFPEADCYFLSVSTMTKYYKSTPDRNVFNNTIKAAFPDQFLDYTDFYAARTSKRMIDTIHFDHATYAELFMDVIVKITQMRQAAEQPEIPEETQPEETPEIPVEFTVTEVQAVFATNEQTVIYAQPSLDSNVILASCEVGLPIQVTGITSNGFFRICVSADGAESYVAGAGLTPLP